MTSSLVRKNSNRVQPGFAPSRTILFLVLFAIWPLAARAQQTIEGYTERQSYVAGDTIQFHVSTNSPTYSIEIIRDAWDPQSIETMAGLAGASYAVPAQGWLGANWPVTQTRVVPAEWVTGSYLARYIAQDGSFAYSPFVIRQSVPGSRSRLAYVMAYNTRNAYNYWGGKSLYISEVPGDFAQSVKVSFLRPFVDEQGKGKGSFLARYAHSQLEAEGFTLEYITEWDIHSISNLLAAYDVLVFAGHHEYISRPLFDAIQAHHDRGGHLAFFSANDLWWQIRYEDNGYTMVGYKQSAVPNDPLYGVNNPLVTCQWREDPVDRPGEQLQGISYVRYSGAFQSENYVVRMGSHWMFEGTGLQNGQTLGDQLAFGETDFLSSASPLVQDVVLYAHRPTLSPFANPPITFCDAVATYYEDSPAYSFPRGRGGSVFASGTQSWPVGLYPGSTDYLIIRRITKNLIQHMLNATPPAAIHASNVLRARIAKPMPPKLH